MVYPPATAQDEILQRIRSLDREETEWLGRAESFKTDAAKLHAEAVAAVARAESLGCVRRQYEFALVQLGGELPPRVSESAAVGAQAKPRNVIGVLG